MNRNIGLVALLLTLNFAIYVVYITAGMARGIVNIDYLISLFISNKNINISYLVLVSLFDLLILVSGIYHFTPISFLEGYEIALHIDLKYYKLSIIGGILLFFLLIIVCRKISNFAITVKKGRVYFGLALIVMLVVIDASLGSLSYWRGKYNSLAPNLINANVATSGLGYLVGEIKMRYFYEESVVAIKPIDSAMKVALNDLGVDEYPEKIILIILESFGSINSMPFRESLYSEFEGSIKVRKSFKTGVIPFFGATTSGEMRELCGVKGDYKIAFNNLDDFHCIPNRLKTLGYSTSAFHYYYRSSFNRNVWWPLVGIDSSYFVDQYVRSSDSVLCGGLFNGGCDKKMIDDLFSSASSINGKSFSYGLTLNSHLPTYPTKDIQNIRPISDKNFSNLTESVQLMVDSWRVVFKAVSDNINVRPESNFLVVIVGDHSPPFLKPEDKAVFSLTHVPYIILKTNSLAIK